MLKKVLISTVAAASCLTASAENKMLPAPDKTVGTTIMEAMSNRRSIREYSSREFSDQELSNLLWASMGQNRPDGRLTAPSCRNFQEIRLFLFDAKGVSEYIPATHSLNVVVEGDYRHLVAGLQDFVNSAPISLVMIADMSKFGDMNPEHAKIMAAVDAGIVSQNVSVACAGLGFATVPRASMEADAIVKLLNLSNHIAIMNNPVGFPVE